MVVRTLFGRGTVNPFEVDRNFRLTLEYYMGKNEYDKYKPYFHDMGEIIGAKLDEISEYTDKIGRPKLIKWSVDGKQVDDIWLNPAHREFLYELYSKGIVWKKFLDNASWFIHFALGYMLFDPGLYCSVTVTLATAYTIYKYGSNEQKEKYLPHFFTQDKEELWQGATWVTEVQGGSDVGANTTIARFENGKWRLYGEKYFTSNVGAELALVTARIEGAPKGAKGISLFLVPRYNENREPNYKITRLKEKIGTIAVPTGEIVMEGSEAELIGKREEGIYYTLEMLTVSRLANIVGSTGLASKALYESINYINMREAFGKKLEEHPLMKFDILDMLVETEAAISLAFRAIQLFDEAWQSKPPYEEKYHHMRLVSHLAKNRTADQSIYVAHRGLEVHGGIGFLEEFPYSRLLREALVLPIWEGTSNVHSLDLLEVIVKKKAHEPFLNSISEMIESLTYTKPFMEKIGKGLSTIHKALETLMSEGVEYASYHAKNLLNLMADVYQAALLAREADWLAEEYGDGRKMLIAKMFIDKHLTPSVDRGIFRRENWMMDLFEDLITASPIPVEKAEKIIAKE